MTGDAVNVAARFEQAAGPGEILIWRPTERLVSGLVGTEAAAPLELKGKSQPVPAFRLIEVLPDAPAFTAPIDAPFVGRVEELARAASRARTGCRERVPQLCTIVGPPGIGKSRLVREFLAGERGRARIVVGRCLPYGEGITYWPLGEIVRQVGGDQPLDAIAQIVGGDEGTLVADRLVGAISLGPAGGSPEEISWAARKLFEALAQDRPLIAVVDDIHWAEPTLLDLLEYVATFATGVPLLVLCTARPDLFETRPTWSNPRRNAVLVSLEPLGTDDAETLIDALQEMDQPMRARIVEAAEGNPLFVEQFLAMRADGLDGELVIPPTMHALLSARLDRLDPGERAVIERAAVEGRLFHRGAVTELLPAGARTAVGSHLITLVRKEFIRPDPAIFPGDDGFRFGHVLIRDSAYESIPKRLRAELHERYATWLEAKLGAHTEQYDEILGFHLEQAHRYLTELGAPDEALAERAAATAGRGGHPGARSRRHGRRGQPARACRRSAGRRRPAVDLEVELGDALESGRLARPRCCWKARLGERARPVIGCWTREPRWGSPSCGSKPRAVQHQAIRAELEPLVGLFEAAGDDRGQRMCSAAGAAGHVGGDYAAAAEFHSALWRTPARLGTSGARQPSSGTSRPTLCGGPNPSTSRSRAAGRSSRKRPIGASRRTALSGSGASRVSPAASMPRARRSPTPAR